MELLRACLESTPVHHMATAAARLGVRTTSARAAPYGHNENCWISDRLIVFAHNGVEQLYC
ncbi:MAG: hypothetical protein EA384_08385 [Spirochaetaceae bacterium]|nr:MAG: hypothetical protein EA384_08385 [Spirochaetaceae bacterium]